MPLFQDMLEAAYYQSGGEKLGPFHFEWPTARQLAKIERRRHRSRVHQRSAKKSPEAIRRAARIWNARHPDKANAKSRKWRASEAGLRYADRRAELQQRETRRAREASKQIARHLTSVALQDLEAPSYTIERQGRSELERWPLRDEAAAWLAQHAPEDTKPAPAVVSTNPWTPTPPCAIRAPYLGEFAEAGTTGGGNTS